MFTSSEMFLSLGVIVCLFMCGYHQGYIDKNKK